MSKKIYEIADTTSDEVYFSLGLFGSFEQAKEELLKNAELDQKVSDFTDDDVERLVIYEREMGWNDIGHIVLVVEREWKYIEDEDDNRWVITSIRDEL